MAKITVADKAVVITSGVKFEDIKKVEKYRPEALKLMGGENGKDEIFRLGTGCAGISRYGASFDAATRDEHKLAVLTVLEENMGEDVKGFIADKYGAAITHLNELEAKLPEVLAAIDTERAAIMAGITVA